MQELAITDLLLFEREAQELGLPLALMIDDHLSGSEALVLHICLGELKAQKSVDEVHVERNPVSVRQQAKHSFYLAVEVRIN